MEIHGPLEKLLQSKKSELQTGESPPIMVIMPPTAMITWSTARRH
jgi:hypothetical protein